MKVWTFIRQFMRDTESANNIQFSDSAWERAKQLEQDIEHYIYENYEKPNTPQPGDDGLLTCFRCRDRYTTNRDGVCEYCKKQMWLDTHA